MKKLLFLLIVFLGMGGAGVAGATDNGLAGQTLVCSGPEIHYCPSWYDIVKLCGDSTIDDLSISKCDTKRGKKLIVNIKKEGEGFGGCISSNITVGVWGTGNDSKCTYNISSYGATYPVTEKCENVKNDYFSYTVNIAPKKEGPKNSGDPNSVGAGNGEVVFESFHNFITEDKKNSPAIISVETDKPVESPAVAGASTEQPAIEDPKIELLRQQVDILKAMIQLLLGRLEAMRGV